MLKYARNINEYIKLPSVPIHIIGKSGFKTCKKPQRVDQRGLVTVPPGPFHSMVQGGGYQVPVQ